MIAPEVPVTQADCLSQAETQRAGEVLALIVPLSVSSTWDGYECRTILRAMLAYGDIVNGVAWTEANSRIAALEAEIARLREGLTDIIGHFNCTKGNAPGHAHTVPGVWDDDIGNRAAGCVGICDWCTRWNAALLTLSGPLAAPQRTEEA